MRTRFSKALAALAMSLPAAGVPAQQTAQQVVGITRAAGQRDPQLARLTVDGSGCAISRCAVSGFEPGASACAGGSAVNGDVPPNLTQSRGGIFVSNGKKIALLDPTTCDYRCTPQNAPLVSPSAVVTGLAYWEDEATLLMSDSDNLLYWVDTTGCALRAVACDAFKKNVVPPGYTIAGLALDDNRRILFISASKFGQASAGNKIWMVWLGPPQRPISAGWCPGTACEMAVPACQGTTLGALTGLGFDACRDTLYYTDGKTVLASSFVLDLQKKTCSLKLVGCCGKSSGEPFSGLAFAQKQPSSVGKSCVEAPCIDCPGMRAGSYGAAFLGNKNFALTLTAAPTGATPAFLAIGIGGCTTPGVPIGFCGTVRVSFRVPPLVIPMRVTSVGAGPCDGTALLSLGVPGVAALCGLPLSTQWAMNCVGPGGPGKAITNCLTFEITSN